MTEPQLSSEDDDKATGGQILGAERCNSVFRMLSKRLTHFYMQNTRVHAPTFIPHVLNTNWSLFYCVFLQTSDQNVFYLR